MRRSPAAPLVVLVTACYAFPAADLGQCHNSIIEANEDCDDADPDHCLDCRLVCTPYVSDTRCPEGRVCGSDGLCRAPSGEFAAEAVRIERAGVHWLAVGDLDGDRRDDVVVQTSQPAVEVIHFAEQPVTVRLALALGRAAVVDLDGDDRAEVALGHAPDDDGATAERGLSLLGERRLGEDDRAPVARVLASLVTEGSDARLLAPSPARDRVLEVVSPSITRWWSSGAHDATTVSPALPFDASTLARAVAIDDLDHADEPCSGAPDGADFPERELALASIGGDRIHVLSSCGGGASFVLDELPSVRLPTGVTLGEAGTFFADVDADGRTDLLTQASAGEVLVSYGVGDGSFHGSTPAPAQGGDGRFADAPLWIAGPGEVLLVVAELDGHPQVELVTDESFVHAPEACDALCLEPWPATLDAALAIDLDDDGALDVATIAGDLLGVALTELTDDRVMLTRQERMLTGAADTLTFGDFDHDTVDDLAMIERDADGHGTAVGVIYGGSPSDWRHESFGPFFDAQALVVDHRDTLVVRALDGLGRASGAFVRRDEPTADFGFAVHQPVAVHANDATVVAAITTHPGEAEDRLVHFGFAGGTLSPHDIVDGAVLTGMAAGEGASALIAAIELGGEGRTDELVVLGTTTEGGTIWIAQLEPSSGAWVVIDRLLAGPGFALRSHAAAEGPGSSLLVGDIDRDAERLPDVLVTTDEVLPRALVLRSSGGQLSARPPIALFDAVHFDSFELAHVQPWHDADDGAPRWLVGGDDGVGIATVELDEERIVIDDVTSAHARALASADVDADGLLDLVIATTQDIRIHLAQERVGGD